MLKKSVLIISGIVLLSFVFMNFAFALETKGNATKCSVCQSSAGPETQISKNYTSSGINFGQNSFETTQLSRDTPSGELAIRSQQIANQDAGIIAPSWVYSVMKYYYDGSLPPASFQIEINYLMSEGIIKQK